VNEVETARYLIDARLLSAQSVVDDSLEIVSSPSRNSVMRVTTDRGPSYIVKHFRGGAQAALHEAQALAFLRSAAPDAAPALPTLSHVDEERGSTVFELSPADDLGRYHLQDWDELACVASRVGQLLATLHSVPAEAIPQDLRSDAISAHACLLEPDERFFSQTSRASIQLVALGQSDQSLRDSMEKLPVLGQYIAYTHGDVRWSNILVLRHVDPGTRPELQIIDWETSGLGDPAWDVACMFAENLSTWLTLIPKSLPSDTYRNLGRADYSTECLQRTISRFWDSYTTTARLDGTAKVDLLERAVRFTAARLIARAIEIDHQANLCSVDAVTHVQVGAQMLARPVGVTAALLGLTDVRPRA
jgi:aminoglycoside phosphotransferase